jgi:hypothetical protein
MVTTLPASTSLPSHAAAALIAPSVNRKPLFDIDIHGYMAIYQLKQN